MLYIYTTYSSTMSYQYPLLVLKAHLLPDIWLKIAKLLYLLTEIQLYIYYKYTHFNLDSYSIQYIPRSLTPISLTLIPLTPIPLTLISLTPNSWCRYCGQISNIPIVIVEANKRCDNNRWSNKTYTLVFHQNCFEKIIERCSVFTITRPFDPFS